MVHGPRVRWIGWRYGRRRNRRWAKAWSTEQISDRLRLDFPDDASMRISHEALYQSRYVQGALRRELTACLPILAGRTTGVWDPQRRTWR